MLARVFGFEPTMLLPMVSGLWLAIHFSPKNRMSEFFLASFGVVVAWLLYNELTLRS